MKVRHLRVSLALFLLSSFFAGFPTGGQPPPEPSANAAAGVGLRGVVIPVGFEKGRYSALVQIAVDGSPLPGATWELEASLVVGGKEQGDFSGRVVVGEPGIPAVLETQTTIVPGPYEIKLKAVEATAGQTGAGQFSGTLPDPDKKPVTVSPVAIVQPAEAAFVRDGNSRSRGALGCGADEPVSSELPAAMVSLVCRGRHPIGVLRVERNLKGANSVDFDPIQIELNEERCVQVRDLISPGTMTHGFFRYDVRVFDDHGKLASGHRIFTAGKPAS